ncbi:MAG TPA: SRPBCC domain-containing protein [Terriglobales bacterium]|nr:SRPBCC domain-containing protein [Terriglobales bacterium]
MAEVIVTPDQDAVISEVHINAPAERVFQALTDPRQLMRWWNSDECQTEFFEMDARPGGQWRFGTKKSTLTVDGVSLFFCQGEVLEFDPPRLLAHTWIANWHDDKTRRTIVRWELTPTKDGTVVKGKHSGLARESVARKDYSGGWPGVMELLKKFAER